MGNEEREQKVKEFQELCRPLNDWLQKNYHLHAKIIIETDHAEIVEGLIGCPFDVVDSTSNTQEKKCANCAMKNDCSFRKTFDNPPYFRCNWWQDIRVIN